GTTTLPMSASNVVSADLNEVRVLVVDDNATNRAILQSMLTRWGMRPTVVDGGPAALALLKHEHAGREHFRLLIVDAQMPEMDGFNFVECVRSNEAWGRPAIMMLSSATFHDDVRRCREIGIDLYLTKPVRAAELRDAVSRVLANTAATDNIGPLTVAPKEQGMLNAIPLRVLLAEDNAVNRRLALALLERRGAIVTVAVDGREALDAWAPGRFDVILMDIQMPEMDGLEVTRAIRAREADGDHVAIVALTARAMAGDRERCLAAGMDGYIAKPLRAAELMEALDRVSPATDGSNSAEAAAVPVFDLPALLENTGHDPALVQELVALFRDDAPRHLARIHSAAAAGRGDELQHAAHALKGAASAITASAVAAAALTLEKAGRAGDLTDAQQLIGALESQLGALEAALSVLRNPSSLALAS
ncbi:MAG TPA: response regulator, partial [Gemmatimonadaceae bacterium]|nr:response regulator [Gemmatimonadaceae bacterium]